jgi:dihydrofolate reductase
VKLTLIAAMDEARLLANAHGIPWKLPRDVKHFRDYTRGKWLLLGRRTFEEMRGWLCEGHMPLVLSNRCGWDPAIGRVVASVPQAAAHTKIAGQDELVVCGGAQTYEAALPYADEIILTTVAHRFDADEGAKYFPEWSLKEWSQVSREEYPPDAENAYPMSIAVLRRQIAGADISGVRFPSRPAISGDVTSWVSSQCRRGR